jgi:hypothetical protein
VIQHVLSLLSDPRRRRTKGYVGIVSEQTYSRSRESSGEEVTEPQFISVCPCRLCVGLFVEGIQAVNSNDAFYPKVSGCFSKSSLLIHATYSISASAGSARTLRKFRESPPESGPLPALVRENKEVPTELNKLSSGIFIYGLSEFKVGQAVILAEN